MTAYIPKTQLALHKRRYQDGDEVPLEELKAVLPVAARAVKLDPAYLPIFLRLEQLIAEKSGRQAVLERVSAMAGLFP